jgi:hypothetical protein
MVTGVLFTTVIVAKNKKCASIQRIVLYSAACIAVVAALVGALGTLTIALRELSPMAIDCAIFAALVFVCRSDQFGEVLLAPLNVAFLCSAFIISSSA